MATHDRPWKPELPQTTKQQARAFKMKGISLSRLANELILLGIDAKQKQNPEHKATK